MVDRTISHYQVLEKLGEGGMGVVYKAEDTKLRRTVALKFLRSETLDSGDLKTRFLHEAEAAAALDHPNICTVYEIDEAEGHTFIAMAYVEGESLQQKVAARPLPLEQALEIALQIGGGLQAAHRKEIVHRDIKSANVMLTAEGQVKIMDFGLAHLGGHTRITRTGDTLGTPAYMSPEQVRGQGIDRRSDTWSLGVVLYEMIAGRLPFRGEVGQAVMYSILNEEPEPLTGLRSGLPIDLDRVVGKVLAKNPDERYQHVDELLVDLRIVRRQLERGEQSQPQAPSPHVEVAVGQMLGQYRLEAKLGEGGMGVVFRALDTHLDRPVAIKVLRSHAIASEERKRRFVQEAKAASALNHPSIVTVHDVNEAAGVDYIVMEYVDGQTLDQVIGPKGLMAAEALRYALPLADALAKAHAAGIVHRDIKPGNVMVTKDGLVKILDFGLAKLTETAREKGLARLQSREAVQTQEGRVVGTVAYMAPEQAEGKPVDQRADVFSFGVVLYEMLSGLQPFQRDSALGTLTAILRDEPPALDSVRTPQPVRRIVERALRKRPEERYPSAGELAAELAAAQKSAQLPGWMKRRRVLAGVAAVVLAVAGLGGWSLYRQSRIRWATNEGLPEIARLLAEGHGLAAFDLAQEVRRLIPDDSRFQQLWPEVARTPLIDSDPPGAEIYLSEMGVEQKPWRHVGTTPVKDVAMPYGHFRWKAVKPGFAEATGAASTWWMTISFLLPPQGEVPEGMVLVPGAGSLGGTIGTVPVLAPQESYFIDRFEVTNRQYKEFVDRGGYEKREYWKMPFSKDGRTLTWEEAMGEFRDATGRPGPSTWEGGTFAGGKDEFPVSGVSWFEAAAYAQFAGKSLPTISHWFLAADIRTTPFVIPASNFGGKGPASVGAYGGIGPFGTFDMAGNVQEWSWNEAENGFRFILGGAWSSPTYQFNQPDAKPPFDRSLLNGFRCALYTKPPPQPLLASRTRSFSDYSRKKPVGDEAFRIIRGSYDYDPKDLKAAVDNVDDSSPYWRKESVNFDAAYGAERVPAFLFLPKSARPPYQALVYHPSAGAASGTLDSLDAFSRVDFIIRSGRAVIYPVYIGTFNRRLPPVRSPLEAKERHVRRYQDMKQSVEYLLSRGDIDSGKLGYIGSSWGAAWAPVMVSLEERFKTAVLFEGGLYVTESPLPEINNFNFLPRVRVPVLMLNGRYDYTFPVTTSQEPYFRWLGTPEKDKRHIVYDSAHDVMVFRTKVVSEVLSWLDKYLGPVAR